MSQKDKNSIVVDIDKKKLEMLKDAFSNTSYAKITLDLVKNVLKISCPVKKKVAAHRTIIQLEDSELHNVTDEIKDVCHTIVMRLSYPNDLLACMRIPDNEEHMSIALIVKGWTSDEVNAIRMEVCDPKAGVFKFEALSTNITCLWGEVKDDVLNQPTSYTIEATDDVMWTINTLNKMSRTIDAFVILAYPEGEASINVYSGLDDAAKVLLVEAVQTKQVDALESIPTINTIDVDLIKSSKNSDTVIDIISPECISILPFNKPAGIFHINSSLVYYDIDGERYVLPVKRQL